MQLPSNRSHSTTEGKEKSTNGKQVVTKKRYQLKNFANYLSVALSSTDITVTLTLGLISRTDINSMNFQTISL